jgi:hypothetical protein
MPDVKSLPADLRRLVQCNAALVDHRTVDADVQRLLSRIKSSRTRYCQGRFRRELWEGRTRSVA